MTRAERFRFGAWVRANVEPSRHPRPPLLTPDCCAGSLEGSLDANCKIFKCRGLDHMGGQMHTGKSCHPVSYSEYISICMTFACHHHHPSSTLPVGFFVPFRASISNISWLSQTKPGLIPFLMVVAGRGDHLSKLSKPIEACGDLPFAGMTVWTLLNILWGFVTDFFLPRCGRVYQSTVHRAITLTVRVSLRGGPWG